MSNKIELEVVATFDGLYLTPVAAMDRGTELCRLADAQRLLDVALAQQPAPAAPVAVGQERFPRCSILKDMPVRYAAHAAPPAAEQPDTVAVPRETLRELFRHMKNERNWYWRDRLRQLLEVG